MAVFVQSLLAQSLGLGLIQLWLMSFKTFNRQYPSNKYRLSWQEEIEQ